ncbi:MAG: tyrosine-type recombinase/integrase [Roseburia sp.]|nr:tyrosine-type recombinase/integrase [Ruminococcus sp.]MCM1156777.1 tyrosine-type recombinase/integrase [Roseburia sp.]MCM1243500.1 tyrosine-type recombinase/integrase [Roseburia sp.]
MSITYPIKNKETLNKFKDYYKDVKPDPRNYTMIIMGLNTAFRIGDLLQIKWQDVVDISQKKFHTHIAMTEQKTGKKRIVAVNTTEQQALSYYLETHTSAEPADYLFQSKKYKGMPLSRYQAYRIVKEAARYVGLEENIGCHSLRKTFGYHAWQQGTSPVMLMNLYNHSSYQTTKHYLGIEQEEKDNVYLHIEL